MRTDFKKLTPTPLYGYRRGTARRAPTFSSLFPKEGAGDELGADKWFVLQTR